MLHHLLFFFCCIFVHSLSAFTHFSLLKVASSFHGIDRYRAFTFTFCSSSNVIFYSIFFLCNCLMENGFFSKMSSLICLILSL